MSTHVFGTRDHSPLCRQRAGRPPVLCGCQTLPIQSAPAGQRLDAEVGHTRIGSALRALFNPIDRDAA